MEHEGAAVGAAVGALPSEVGVALGASEGAELGARVGVELGAQVGAEEGTAVGPSVDTSSSGNRRSSSVQSGMLFALVAPVMPDALSEPWLVKSKFPWGSNHKPIAFRIPRAATDTRPFCVVAEFSSTRRRVVCKSGVPPVVDMLS